MNSLTADRLYGLLPAIYRLRDVDQGEPLRALQDHLQLTGAVERVPGRVYVLSEAFRPSPFWQFHDALQSDPDWRVLKLPTLHDAMISMPDEVTAILESTLATES